VRRGLAHRRIAIDVAVLVLLLYLPTIWSGLSLDDFFHELVVEGKLAGSRGRLDIFDLISSDPIRRARFLELGAYPWWTGPRTHVSYWRPLAALTHFVDYSLWPRAAWWMHAQTLVWYGAVVVACGALYRRFIRVPWIAGLATVFYAFDPFHAFAVAWNANRNGLMSMFFGAASLLAHHRWRSERRPAFGALGCASFALALMSAEGGCAIVGYTAAYAIAFERGSSRRLLSLAPYAAVAVAWRATYRWLGHGVIGSDINIDPLVDPCASLARGLQTIPLLLGSQVTSIPTDILVQHQAWTAAAAIAAVAIVALFGYALWPGLRSDRSARFFALGALLSALPLAGTFPIERYFFWVGLGVVGLTAMLAGGVFGEYPWPGNRVRSALCAACVFTRGVLAPASIPLRAALPGLVEDQYERMIETIPYTPGLEETVVVINAPTDLVFLTIPFIALAKGLPVPAHFYTLYAGAGDVTITRSGPRSLETKAQLGWLAPLTGRAFRNDPLAVGEGADLASMSARVTSLTSDGRPDAVRFSFAQDLDDPSLVLLAWGTRGFERIVPPAGRAVVVQPPPGLLPEVMRWHVRRRAFEDGQLFTGR
jgi:hypothetical protein